MMNLVELLNRQTEIRPDAPAIIDMSRGRNRVMTFAELELASQRVATLLQNRNLKAGDAVLIFQPMSAELYITLLALLRLGLVAMFVDPSAGHEYVERCCHIFPPRSFIACSRGHTLRLFSAGLRRIPIKFSIGWPVPGARRFESAAALEPTPGFYVCSPDTPALLTFTSGSTGQPKPALRTHDFLLAQHQVLEKALDLVPGETDLATLPIFVLANLARGVTSLIARGNLRHPSKISALSLLTQIQEHRPTTLSASPALMENLTEHCVRENVKLLNLRKVFTGGGPVFPRLLDQIHSMAPHADIVAIYGSTEAEPIARISHDEISSEDVQAMRHGRGLLAGKPVPEIEVRILQEQWGKRISSLRSQDFATLTQPCQEPGEIVVSGRHVLSEYFNGIGNFESKFRVDGLPWHRTGDAGYLDERGRLWLLGRCSAKIQDARGTVYPFSVESAAVEITGVRRAATVSRGGRRLLALETVGTADLHELQRALDWAQLDEVRVVSQIPVDARHNAKVDYRALNKMLG